MEYLFDQDKPYFVAWLQLHDMDTPAVSGSIFYLFATRPKSGPPLYYAALCGFQDLVNHLIVNNPSHVNARGGYYLTPLVAALAAGHFQTAEILRDNGAHPNLHGAVGRTPLHSAAFYGNIEMVQVLLKYEADVNARTSDGGTPLHLASKGLYPGGPDFGVSLSNIARLFLEHGADVNAQGGAYSSPVHEAARHGRVEVVRVLLEHVANLGVGEDDRKPPSHVLSEYVNARDSKDKTLLHYASEGPFDGGSIIGLSLSNSARLLLEHGADVNAGGNDQSSPLHVAAQRGRVEVVRVLLEHGANLGAEDGDGKTALQVASDRGHDEVMKLLSEHGAR
jgi:ankyrin repeat protein